MSDEMIEKAFDDWFINKYRYDYKELVIPESVKPQIDAFTAGFKAASKPLKDGDSYYVCGQKVYTQDYVEALEKKLEEVKELLSSYDAQNLHDEGCIGAYDGREIQCDCNLRDVRKFLNKMEEA